MVIWAVFRSFSGYFPRFSTLQKSYYSKSIGTLDASTEHHTLPASLGRLLPTAPRCLTLAALQTVLCSKTDTQGYVFCIIHQLLSNSCTIFPFPVHLHEVYNFTFFCTPLYTFFNFPEVCDTIGVYFLSITAPPSRKYPAG